MGYKNSSPYVQQQLDRILRPHKAYAKGYIDDVVIFSMMLNKHIQHRERKFSTAAAIRNVIRAHFKLYDYGLEIGKCCETKKMIGSSLKDYPF